MKRFWKDLGIAFTMGMIVPSVLLGAAISLRENRLETRQSTVQIFITEPVNHLKTTEEGSIAVLDESGLVTELPIGEYLTCVVLAEIPVTFEEEALKAQTVVARTYAMRAATGTSKHDDAAVCMDSGCCQAYISQKTYLQNGGKMDSISYIRSLVDATAGQVLTYDGNLIEATYFSCSGGTTEDAVAVWGTDVPYLQSVQSPGEEDAAHYEDAVTFASDDFASLLGMNLQGEPEEWFSDPVYTNGGGVATILIGEETFSGTDLRKMLGLRSTAFTVTTEGELITIRTRGYGHRVGMSQYGANAMASSGSTYAEILAHYYQGTELTMLNN